jgi:hypothetical protein
MLTMKRLENVLKMMEDETQRLANELAESKQQHQATRKKLAAAEELHTIVLAISPPIHKPAQKNRSCHYNKHNSQENVRKITS